MEKFFLIICVILMVTLTGCQNRSVNIVNESGIISPSETGEKENIMLNLEGYKGKMIFELEDAYITDHLLSSRIDVSKIDEYSFVTIADEGAGTDYNYPEYFEDKMTGKLREHCKLFVCKIKVTNIDATYEWEDEYDSPYIFRADNIWLTYINEKGKIIQTYPIDYYSLRKDGDHTWSTYEVQPGKSLEYEVGFVVGNAVYSDSGELTVADDYKHFYLGNTTGSEDGEYYQVKWREQ